MHTQGTVHNNDDTYVHTQVNTLLMEKWTNAHGTMITSPYTIKQHGDMYQTYEHQLKVFIMIMYHELIHIWGYVLSRQKAIGMICKHMYADACIHKPGNFGLRTVNLQQ